MPALLPTQFSLIEYVWIAAGRGMVAMQQCRVAQTRNVDADSEEAKWRQLVAQRKAAERLLKQQKASQPPIVELAEVAMQESPYQSPKAAARSYWKVEDAKAKECRLAAASAHQELVDRWLQDEWGPLFARNRAERRAEREHASRREADAAAADALQRDWELAAMEREECEMRGFLREVALECSRRQRTSQQSAHAEYEKHQERILEERRNASLQRGQEERRQRLAEVAREQEYRDWRARLSLCRRTSCASGSVAPQATTLECVGAGERLTEDALRRWGCLEDFLQRAVEEAKVPRSDGLTPRQVLQRSRALADAQKAERQRLEPKKVEQELWDTLLAKNRLAKQRERRSERPAGKGEHFPHCWSLNS